MALLAGYLSVRAIGFIWRGLDPDRLWWRLPVPVKDSFLSETGTPQTLSFI